MKLYYIETFFEKKFSLTTVYVHKASFNIVHTMTIIYECKHTRLYAYLSLDLSSGMDTPLKQRNPFVKSQPT